MTLHGNVLHVWWCSLSLMMSLARHICVSRWSPSPLAGADRLGGPRLRTPSCSRLCLTPATGKGAGHRVGGSQALISSSTELGGHTCSIVHQGSSSETRAQCLRGWSRRHPLPAGARAPGSQRESDTQQGPHCFHRRFRPLSHSHRNGGNPPAVQAPGGEPWASLASRPLSA